MPGISPQDLQSFRTHLKSSTHILALLGAGLSASSGLPTFRGAGGLWRSYDATSLATPQAFRADPGLVWQFYSYRRNMAKHAKPNRAHVALSQLAKKLSEGVSKGEERFLCLSQNVDGLSQRAGHSEENGLRLLHGSLWDVKCLDKHCGYVRKNDFEDPICPALAMPNDDSPPERLAAKGGSDSVKAAKFGNTKDVADAAIDLPAVPRAELPHCPKCKSQLLRPGVVWFNESLPQHTLKSIDTWVDSFPKIDLMLVIGTSSVVWPAAGYTDIARRKGARVAVVNLEESELNGLTKGDWMFKGDAAQVVPELLKDVIGEVGEWTQ